MIIVKAFEMNGTRAAGCHTQAATLAQDRIDLGFAGQGPSSTKEGAEYGQTDTQTPHWLHIAGSVSAMVPLVKMVSRASRVTALDAAAWPWAMDSSMGLG